MRRYGIVLNKTIDVETQVDVEVEIDDGDIEVEDLFELLSRACSMKEILAQLFSENLSIDTLSEALIDTVGPKELASLVTSLLENEEVRQLAIESGGLPSTGVAAAPPAPPEDPEIETVPLGTTDYVVTKYAQCAGANFADVRDIVTQFNVAEAKKGRPDDWRLPTKLEVGSIDAAQTPLWCMSDLSPATLYIYSADMRAQAEWLVDYMRVATIYQVR
jgi:hypothetical protein